MSVRCCVRPAAPRQASHRARPLALLIPLFVLCAGGGERHRAVLQSRDQVPGDARPLAALVRDMDSRAPGTHRGVSLPAQVPAAHAARRVRHLLADSGHAGAAGAAVLVGRRAAGQAGLRHRPSLRSKVLCHLQSECCACKAVRAMSHDLCIAMLSIPRVAVVRSHCITRVTSIVDQRTRAPATTLTSLPCQLPIQADHGKNDWLHARNHAGGTWRS